ncbi:MAG: hypothetical protein U0559_17570 [Anaerolineae bacterium]
MLVILSIAVGVAAVGMINNAASIDRTRSVWAVSAGNPALVQIYVRARQRPPTLALPVKLVMAQARRTTAATVFDFRWVARDITLNTLPDFNDIQINRLPIEQGTGVPGVREICWSVNRLKAWGRAGDTPTVEIDNQRRYELTVVGNSATIFTFDLYRWANRRPVSVDGDVELAGLVGLLQPPRYCYYDRRSDNREHVLPSPGWPAIALIQLAGYTVSRIVVPGYSSDPVALGAESDQRPAAARAACLWRSSSGGGLVVTIRRSSLRSRSNRSASCGQWGPCAVN